jgi:hypothetical protein
MTFRKVLMAYAAQALFVPIVRAVSNVLLFLFDQLFWLSLLVPFFWR